VAKGGKLQTSQQSPQKSILILQGLHAGSHFLRLLPRQHQLLLQVDVCLRDLVDSLILLTDQILVLKQDPGVGAGLSVGALVGS
jgi:hypothetical protein